MRRRYSRRRSNNNTGLAVIAFFSIFLIKATGLSLNHMLMIGFVILFVVIFGYTTLKYIEKHRYLESGIEDIDQMSGEEFENCLKFHFQGLGYCADTTPRSHDYGADLVLKKNGETIIVQAKRYNNSVGIKSVQEAVGAMSYYKASEGYVITNSYFTESAKNLARESGIILWDRDTIIKNFHIPVFNEERIVTSAPICRRCGKVMVVKNGINGPFYRCSGNPTCRYTKNIN
jgi:restriction system protein